MKTDVLNLCALLGNAMGDPVVMGNLYDDMVESWASLNILTVADVISVAANQATFDMPTDLLTLRRLIYDNVEMGKLELREVEAIDPGWRNRHGRPRSYIIDTENPRTVAFYPSPAFPSGPDLGIYGEPTGRDYPTYSVVLIGAERRATVPVQFELPMALLVLAREFARESDHTDLDFAALCAEIGSTLLQMARGIMP